MHQEFLQCILSSNDQQGSKTRERSDHLMCSLFLHRLRKINEKAFQNWTLLFLLFRFEHMRTTWGALTQGGRADGCTSISSKLFWLIWGSWKPWNLLIGDVSTAAPTPHYWLKDKMKMKKHNIFLHLHSIADSRFLQVTPNSESTPK